MAIRLLALDIDGTLTDALHEVGQVNLDAVRRARDAGVYVTVATGRGYRASRQIIRALDISGPVVHFGGAWVLDAPAGSTLQLLPLEPDIVHDVLALARELDAATQLYQGDAVIVETPNPFTERYVSRFDLPLIVEPRARDKQFTDVPKMLMLTTPDREEEIVRACEERLCGIAEVSRSQGGFIEINRLGVSKATGLACVAQLLDVRQEETASMGDSYLDMEMLRWAGMGVCVENGVEAAKECADLVVPSCEDNGVAYFIDHYVLR